jgi:hypothetical protein
MPLQLARLVESDKGLGEKWLTGVVSLDVAQASFSIQRSLIYRPVWSKTSRPVSRAGRSKRPSRQPRHLVMAMPAGVAQGGLISHVLCSLYVNDMPSPSQHAELVRLRGRHGHHSQVPQPVLLFSYVRAFFSELER